MSESSRDRIVRELRDEIADLDRTIVEAINKRLELVARLKEHKISQGYELVDRAREEWMMSYLSRANSGPLSTEGLREIYSALLDLTKRELAITPSGVKTR